MLSIQGLTKTYASGLVALKSVDLEVRRGEILALLGPNGAGKTTLISIVCGLVTPGAGRVRVDGYDILAGCRETRARIGLVPQELHTDMFETVLDTVRFSRGLFGLSPDPDHLRQVLESLSLWDKRGSRIMALSGGMKRRLLIAKALAHEPGLLFLDEPTAGVDVELRRDTNGLIIEQTLSFRLSVLVARRRCAGVVGLHQASGTQPQALTVKPGGSYGRVCLQRCAHLT